MDNKYEVILTVNGPGELYGLAKPLTMQLRRKYGQNIVITLFTVPCQFSSGLEHQRALELGLFDNVFSVSDYWRFLFLRRNPEGYQPAAKGLVFYVGGDSVHALKIAKRFGYAAYAYDEGNLTNKKKFKRLFLRGADGDLMVDAALERKISCQIEPAGSAKLTVGLYPGSRPHHLPTMVTLFSEVAVNLRKKYPGINFYWGINNDLRPMFENDFPGKFAAPYEAEDTKYDLIISLTGTNTAISATLGIPLLVLLPFNDPKQVPLMGLMGLITAIPVIGYLIKALAVRLITKQMKLISIPNIKAGRKIVPELVGIISADDICREAEKVLLDVDYRKMVHEELPIFMGKPAAKHIVEQLSKEIQV